MVAATTRRPIRRVRPLPPAEQRAFTRRWMTAASISGLVPDQLRFFRHLRNQVSPDAAKRYARAVRIALAALLRANSEHLAQIKRHFGTFWCQRLVDAILTGDDWGDTLAKAHRNNERAQKRAHYYWNQVYAQRKKEKLAERRRKRQRRRQQLQQAGSGTHIQGAA